MPTTSNLKSIPRLYKAMHEQLTLCAQLPSLLILMMQAKLILRRIELRDLYACSGKIRVPKMLSETGDVHGDQRSDPIAGAQKHHNGHLWRAMQAMKLQPQGETIYDLLDHDAKQRIKINDIWIEVCDITLYRMLVILNLIIIIV